MESGVKVITHEIIRAFGHRRFVDLDELNTAITAQVDKINTRTPFRGHQLSRKALFADAEQAELQPLPAQPWQPVTWKKAKVNRDYHVEIATVKYSVPYTYVGRAVDAKITGDHLTVFCDGHIIAQHHIDDRKHVFVTDPDHVPAQHRHASDLWSRAYFERQAHKIGPNTVEVVTTMLDRQRIEAQGYRTCQNIIGLAKDGSNNKTLLERACQEVMTQDMVRPVSYTAVKQRMAALRAQAAARPTTTNSPGGSPPDPVPDRRDTSGAHLAGPERFQLNVLLNRPTPQQQDRGQR